MPKGGRNRKPTALRVLTGADRPDRRRHEPKPPPIAPPRPPGLDRYGRQLWRRLAPQLEKHGLLTALDGDMLALLCDAYSQWRRATTVLRDLAPGDPAYRPVAVTVEKARHDFRLLATEFGLSPASRGRIDLPPAAAEEDPLEQLLCEVERRPK